MSSIELLIRLKSKTGTYSDDTAHVLAQEFTTEIDRRYCLMCIKSVECQHLRLEIVCLGRRFEEFYEFSIHLNGGIKRLFSIFNKLFFRWTQLCEIYRIQLKVYP
mmetsp:Transcript_13227/g.23763  ORF Transcript_13227/g.23763 Transcript_13227/m.23763 type:complete len:105 (+) Transcript_13227:444-758(+)